MWRALLSGQSPFVGCGGCVTRFLMCWQCLVSCLSMQYAISGFMRRDKSSDVPVDSLQNNDVVADYL